MIFSSLFAREVVPLAVSKQPVPKISLKWHLGINDSVQKLLALVFYGVSGMKMADVVETLLFIPRSLNWLYKREKNKSSRCLIRLVGGTWWPAPALQLRHNGREGVSNHQPRDCLLNRLCGRRSKKTSKLRVTGLCAGNSPLTGEFPAQKVSNAENAFIEWCHHGCRGVIRGLHSVP